MRLRGLRSSLVPVTAVLLLGLAACSAPAASPSPSPNSGSPGASINASPSAGDVVGVAGAGPVCPVERPGDPACAPRPVAGAVIVVTRPDGSEVARVTTAADGRFSLNLPPGDYVLVPQPVQGMMGTAPSVPFNVGPTGQPGSSQPLLQVEYDTGIR
ncbi:MAG: carboxypeptidase-like regulatory domain-containing protein [Chloroflexota bacterium]|nr:carboxypeptidase-like regulatory domain-containing protein [Chloroflexota bacterium]